jgi:hypothetical protein
MSAGIRGAEDMYLTIQRMSPTRQKIVSGECSVFKDNVRVVAICTEAWSFETTVGCPIGGEQVIAAYILSSEV